MSSTPVGVLFFKIPSEQSLALYVHKAEYLVERLCQHEYREAKGLVTNGLIKSANKNPNAIWETKY